MISIGSKIGGSIFFLIPIGGTILYIAKELIRKTREVSWLKISMYVVTILYGSLLFSFFFVKIWFNDVEIAGWIYALALILSAPYFGIVFGFYYGLGAASAASGISATKIINDAVLDKKNEKQ